MGDLKPNAATGDPAHVDVNEGPEVLQRGDKLFLIYSASGCWTEHYCLGMLTATAGSDLLAAIVAEIARAGVHGASRGPRLCPRPLWIFQIAGRTEDWIIYHANSEPGQGCGRFRSPRAQRFSWKPDGTPDFGRPGSVDHAVAPAFGRSGVAPAFRRWLPDLPLAGNRVLRKLAASWARLDF